MAVTSKGLPLDARVELVTPAKPARLSRTTGNSTGDQAPIPGAELADELTENCVFFRRPGTPDSATAPTSPCITITAGIVGSDDVFLVNEGGCCWINLELVHMGEGVWRSAGYIYLPNGKTGTRSSFLPKCFRLCCSEPIPSNDVVYSDETQKRRRLKEWKQMVK